MAATKQKGEAVGVAGRPGPTAIHMDQFGQRDDSDVLFGSFARVTSGDHEGRFGTFESVATVDKDGYPVLVLVRFRDSGSETAEVPYADLAPVERGVRVR